MIEHSYREIVLKGRKKEKIKFVFECRDDDYELVAVFFNSELPSFKKSIFSMFEDPDPAKAKTFTGNRVALTIKDGRVELCDELELLGDCSLSLEEFTELIEEWKKLRT